ncbi:hypothetical protein DFH09DRAFT_1360958 [Mycena vulgaris]|nr:hypothetical protein DFH09DRAFT_1360958 [Mycena vulgaris]
MLSLDAFAAPVPIAEAGTAVVLEVRKAKVAAKKVLVTAKGSVKPKSPIKKTPVVKAKPLPKKVLPSKKVPAAVPKPVAKTAALPKKVTTTPIRPAAKVSTAVKTPAAKVPGKPVTPATNPVVATKPIAKAPSKSAAKPKPSASNKPVELSCPVRRPVKTTTTTKTKKTKRITNLLNAFTREVTIARRTLFGLIRPRLTEGNEFIGWHGTNEKTAALWESTGHIIRPETAEGQVTGRSGLDEELGTGLYITDTLSIAESAAVANSLNNKIPGKILIPEAIRANRPINGDKTIREQERQSYIALLPRKPAASRTPSVLFGPIRTETGRVLSQMMIVESLNPNFEAQCFDLVGADSAGAQAFEAAGNTVSYTDPTLTAQWGIRPEDKDLTTATIAAFEKPCS